ncbi:MAG: nuclease A inhibitor family protein [Anaerolineae bacterium]|nr:nuclease A inhibitor family protein [Gloeobacterales cyanobacterium ES-bin-313]
MPESDDQQLVNLLTEAVDGLLYMSESDYPFSVFLWHLPEPLTLQAVVAQARMKKSTPASVIPWEQFIEPLLDPAQKTAERYQRVKALLTEHLEELQVFRLGKVEVNTYIVGKTGSGSQVGLSTKSIET